MSNWINSCLILFSIELNQEITFVVLIHWFGLVMLLICLFILSRIDLLTFPSSDLFGFISLILGSRRKFGLVSLRVIKASVLAETLIILSSSSFVVVLTSLVMIFFSCTLVAFLYSLCMFSRRSLLCVSL